MVNIQKLNFELIEKVSHLDKNICSLQKHQSDASKKTFAEAVSKSISGPAAQVSIIRAVEAANNSDLRKCAVVLKKTEQLPENSEDELLDTVAQMCQIAKPLSVFRIAQRTGPPLLKIQLQTAEDAGKVLSTFFKHRDNIPYCKNASVRPDLSKPELEKFRLAWKEVIMKNNEAEKRMYTVRNLEVVKIKYRENQEPWAWEVRPSAPKETSKSN